MSEAKTVAVELIGKERLSRVESASLKKVEASIKKGMKSIWIVGAALLYIREKRLYRQSHGTFEEYCQGKWGFSYGYANRLVLGAQTLANLMPMGIKTMPENERQTRPISDLPPGAQKAVWGEVLDRTEGEGQRITAAVIQAVREEMFPPGQEIPDQYLQDEQAPVNFADGKPHVAHNSGQNEWYTPPQYIEAARKAMGSIDTDPASSVVANQTVRAMQFFTADHDGLSLPWAGAVWLNPPYSSDLVGKFAEATASKYEAGEFRQACVLVNNATETAWFQRMMGVASAICFIRSRVRFLNPAGEPVGAPLQGQAVLYLGSNAEAFKEAFEAFGPVWRP